MLETPVTWFFAHTIAPSVASMIKFSKHLAVPTAEGDAAAPRAFRLVQFLLERRTSCRGSMRVAHSGSPFRGCYSCFSLSDAVVARREALSRHGSETTPGAGRRLA